MYDVVPPHTDMVSFKFGKKSSKMMEDKDLWKTSNSSNFLELTQNKNYICVISTRSNKTFNGVR